MSLFLPSAFRDQLLLDISKCEVVVEEALEKEVDPQLLSHFNEVREAQSIQVKKQQLGRGMRQNVDDWASLPKSSKVALLRRHPQIADEVNLDALDGDMWDRVLRMQPHLIAHCDTGKLDCTDWACLLSHQPALVRHCNWDNFNVYALEHIFRNHPQLREYYNNQKDKELLTQMGSCFI